MIRVCAVVLLFVVGSLAQDCQLVVPANPLTAAGLATPYILQSVDANAPCHQAGDGASFVQGAIVDIDTGALYVYNPLVIDKGATPAVAPVVPTLPQNHIIGLWFGTNGDSLTLVETTKGSLDAGNCINGVTNSIFGQFSYCNAPLFFFAVNALVITKKIKVPALGTAKDGQPCPTTRSFFIVDQDQSDNVVTSYLITKSGKLAQNNAANRKAFPNSTVLDNGSDEGLVVLVNNGLGCTSWDVPDLADPGSNLASLPMNEILASVRQAPPIALVPAGDPMVLLADNSQSLLKTNLYRIGVDQFPALSFSQANTTTYCRHLQSVFPTRMNNPTTKKLLSAQPSPDPAQANNLYNFLSVRFMATLENLNCPSMGKAHAAIVNVTLDKDGCAYDTQIDAAAIPLDSWSSEETSSEEAAVKSSANLVLVSLVSSFVLSLAAL